METIKIINGRVLDGTSNPECMKEILIENGMITGIDDEIKEKGDVIIDASGLHVCPGFIDIHTHSDFSILNNEHSPEKLLQGVTTEVVGNCGLGAAPTNEMIRSILNSLVKDYMYGKEIPEFKSLEDFHSKLSEMGHSINIASLLPHGNIRIMSPAGLVAKMPSNDELDELKAIVEKNMPYAFGLSTGLVYPPGSITPKEEIAELCKVVSKYGGFYSSHIRNESSGVIGAIDEAIFIGKEGGVPVQISHVKVAFNNFITRKMLKQFKKARESGIDITGDVYPYIAGGANLGSIVLPPWVFAGGAKSIKKTLMNEKKRGKIIEDSVKNLMMFAKISPKLQKLLPLWFIKLALKFLTKKVMITSTKYTPKYNGMMLNEVLKEYFKEANGIFNQVLNFLAQEEAAVSIAIFQESEKKVLIPILKAPFVMIGTDSLPGHPRTWGSYPKILGKYVREKGILTLPVAINKMTGMPAERLKLKDRGYLREGYKADITIFDS
ncbi:MAG: amidohydrolase family protein, partial [Candidatus Hodarchaeota archaeon]